ncbi:MAG: diguanylate cyclase [Gammaproteobacteria bacterium]|nr:diguanylate cyclase [Gammaproteobacteria bacterium]
MITSDISKNNKAACKSMWILLALVIVTVVSDFILFKSQPFGIKQIVYLISVFVSAGMLMAALKIKNDIVAKFLPQIAFILIYVLMSYQFILSDIKSNYIIVLGLSLLLVWHGSQSVVSYKFSLPVSIVAVISLVAISKVIYGSDVEVLIVLFMVLSMSAALGELATQNIIQSESAQPVSRMSLEDDTLPSDEFSEKELEEFMQPETSADYAMVDVNASDTSHDWEYVLRELYNELKSTHDVDALFKNMLLFMSGAIDFDAAVAGMIQERSMNKISVFGPDEYTHSKVLAWSSDLVGKLSRTLQAEIRQQEITNAEGEVSNIYRIDVPVLSNNKMVGIVTILRKSMCFNEYETKLASSIVFHSMIALRQARLQEEVKRQTVASANKTIYTREQFFEKAKIELEKINQPRTFSLLLIELDDLEKISDSLGMDAASKLYKTVATAMLTMLNSNDALGRYGKEGLVVMLHETDLLEAKKRAENIREKISQLKCKANEGIVTTTVSIGLASVSEQGETIESIVKKADMGLFVAKESGRNSVKVSL